jgi:8-oxo-dGTP diphosphatase
VTYTPESDEEREFLESYDPTKFPIITVTVDVVALHRRPGKDWKVVLIERKNWPYRGKLALPGGFLDAHEDAYGAAARELNEETHFSAYAEELTELPVRSAPDRDPRGRVITLPFLLWLKWDGKPPTIKPGDDAAEAQWFKLKDALNMTLAFDHEVTLMNAVKAADEMDGVKRNYDTWERI